MHPLFLTDSLVNVQQYLTLAVTAIGLSGFIFGFTPKGFPTVVALYNFLSKNFFHKALYGEIARVESESKQRDLELSGRINNHDHRPTDSGD